MDNPSVIDQKIDKKYKDDLLKRQMFVCMDCKHEKPLKDECKGKNGAICSNCFDKRLTRLGDISKVCDSLCYCSKI